MLICFCASLLCTKFTCHVMQRARALSSKVKNNSANGHCCNFAQTFSDPYFSFDGSFSLPIFYILRKSVKSIQEVWIFCKMLHQISLSWPLLPMWQFQMSLYGVCENDGNIWINAKDSLIQNMIRIVCLSGLIFNILT